jgi:hypothetical protein
MLKKFSILLCMLITVFPAFGQSHAGQGGGSTIDPYILNDNTATILASPIYKNFLGKTQVQPPGPVGGQSTAVILALGQSNITNWHNAIYTPTNALVHQIYIYNGGVYSLADPVVGIDGPPTQGTLLGRLGDKLINASKYARVVFVPIGVGGSSVTDWAVGGGLNHRIGVGVARAKSLGFTFTHIMWMQGEVDSVNAMPQATYTTNLNSVISTVTGLGVTATFWIALETWENGGLPAGSAAIRAAQAAPVNGTTVKQGPDLDTLDGTNRWDLAHFNATGSDAAAGLWNAKW